MKPFLRFLWRILFLLFIFTVLFLLFNRNFIGFSLEALYVFSTTILPAVLPFSVVSGFLLTLLGETETAVTLSPLGKPFSLGGRATYSLLTGLLSGYPVGGKTALDYYERGLISIEEGQKVLLLSSCASPLLIITCIGPAFNKIAFGVVIYLCHLTATFLTGLIIKIKSSPTPVKGILPVKTTEDIILNGFTGLIISATLITVFYTAVLLLPDLPFSIEINGLLYGLIETTVGCNILTLVFTPLSVGFTLFILSIGGVAELILLFPIAKKLNLKPVKFFLFRTLQAIISFILSFLSTLVLLPIL